MVQPDHDAPQRRVQDSVYDRTVLLLLQSNALWVEERKCHLPAADGQGASSHARTKCPSVCGRHGGHLPAEGAACSRLGRAVHHNSEVQVEAEPKKVCVRG